MTELAPKTIEETIEDLDLGSADLGQVEADLENDAGGKSSDHTIGKTLPRSASVRLPIYKAFKPAVAKLAEEAAGRIHGHIGSARRCAAEIGKELLSVKDKLAHGHFGKWLEAEFAMTARTELHEHSAHGRDH
ncbi:hypothetical protein C7I87_11540 [Mesorhizobium sp. SARCC-RB16n]|uniref:hypothetical protein n=1 Tax=Mesorhizobium sp. SARCC-RB16n TaxID=2116687 RepID=UPI00122F00A2|nr:hypothetical protein [Mesorhizobium sp. SARCC-RB16n]KAA3450276.1 hypothetical protein C7I87_11540 [Mesorhizobium sp. SARCC-RB16n]